MCRMKGAYKDRSSSQSPAAAHESNVDLEVLGLLTLGSVSISTQLFAHQKEGVQCVVR